MGSLFGKTEEKKVPFESNPWKPQIPYLKEGFSGASDALASSRAILSGIGDYAADLTPLQVSAARLMGRIGLTDSQELSRQLGVNTQSGIDSAGAAIDNADRLYSLGYEDPTERILDNAQEYADNPFLQSQIDAALGDVRSAFDRDVGKINASAVGSGNINSTRSGALEAMAMDDAMDRAADISSRMRMGAFESGLDRAMTTEQRRFANAMAANASMADLGRMGADMGLTGLDVATRGAGLGFQGGTIFQDQDQLEIDARRLKAREPLELARLYMGSVGGNFGQSGYQTQLEKRPGLLQTGLGIASTLGGLGWSPFG